MTIPELWAVIGAFVELTEEQYPSEADSYFLLKFTGSATKEFLFLIRQ
jgi:hypothetical protein